jgi:hypothetical protein
VVHEVERLVDQDRLAHVMVEKREGVVAEPSMFASDPVSRLSRQMTRCPFASSASQVGAEEAGAAGHEEVGIARDATRVR